MQQVIFPMKYINITQAYGPNTYSHHHGYPIDNAGKDTGIDNCYAPFDGVVKKIWANGNSIWLESLDKVKYADGTIDYAVFMATHDNNVSDLRVGQIVKKGEVFYQEGTAGNATGNHVHMEFSRGKFTGTGWHEEDNVWTINKPYKPEGMCVIGDSIIINSGGLKWKKGAVMPSKQDVIDYFRVWEHRKPTSKELKQYTSKSWRFLTDKLLTAMKKRVESAVSKKK